MQALITLADRYELAWRQAVAAGQPQPVVDALELAWREMREGHGSLLDFIARVSPKLDRPEHLRPLVDFFYRAASGSVLCCTSVPPQHGKTVTISHLLVWFMLLFPHRRNAYVSYSIKRAERVGRQMLDIARRAGLDLVVSNQDRWVTRHGGGIIITGIGGSIIGDPVDGIFVVDDAHKDREEAGSATVRDTTVEYVTVTASSRLHPCSSMLVNGTRWHVSDVIGSLREIEDREHIGWEFVNIPAIDADGNALWPKHRPLDFIQRQRKIHGEYDFAAEFLGRPVAEGHEIFGEPNRYDKANIWGGVTLVACDPAATAKTSADSSAIVVANMQIRDDGLPIMDILDVRCMQVEIPQLVAELVRVQKHWESPVVIESVAGFKAVPQMLRAIDPSLRIIEVSPSVDKLIRARPVAAAWNDGRVRVPRTSENAPWLHSFLTEARKFTGIGDKHDDQVDALAHVFNELQRQLNRRRPSAETLAQLAPMG